MQNRLVVEISNTTLHRLHFLRSQMLSVPVKKEIASAGKAKNIFTNGTISMGAVEVYDKQGNHLGEYDATTGEQTEKAKSERQTTIK